MKTRDELVAAGLIRAVPRDTRVVSEGRKVDSGLESPQTPDLSQTIPVHELGDDRGGTPFFRQDVGHQRVPRGMNKLEARRAGQLEAMKRAGEITDWKYEAVTLVLADRLRYTPDFLVVERAYPSPRFRLEEVKGFWRDDARAKIKMAAELFPYWSFIALTPAKWVGHTSEDWHIEAFKPRMEKR